MTRAFWFLVCLWLPLAASAEPEELNHKILTFDELKDWETDDHDAALEVFLNTCPDLADPDWGSLCALAQQKPEAKPFFELFFRPVLIENEKTPLFTGYFEPELNGSLQPDARYRYPVYRQPYASKTTNP